MNLKKVYFLIICCSLFFTGCDNIDLYSFASNPPTDPDAKYFTSFRIDAYLGAINNSLYTITVEVPTGTSLSSLIPVFTIEGDYVEIAGTRITSGATALNFSSPLTMTVVALNGTSQDYTVTVTASGAALNYIEVTPASSSIEVSNTVQLTATAHYTDSSTLNITTLATWSSSNVSVADVAGGLVTANAAGNAVITAAYSGSSDTASVTVTPAALVLDHIEVTPASAMVQVNNTVQLTATAYYTDSSNADVTSAASWSSSNVSVANVTGGLVTAYTTGTTTITAEHDGSPDTATIIVTTQTDFYVSYSSGNDTTGLGTTANPYQTITKAINTATSGCTVHVAQGPYAESIYMKDGVEVYGSYLSDFTSRDIVMYKSTISPTVGFGVYFDTPVGNSTILDGFEIIGSGGSTYAGISLSNSAAPTIQYNIINGGSNPSGQTFGIYISNASPIIQKNEIYGGNCAIGSSSRGIFMYDAGSSPDIINNIIIGGSGESTTGIWSNGSTGLVVRNNTISAGAGTTTLYGIYLSSSTSAIIQNNIIFHTGLAGTNYGIYEADAGSDPLSVENNDIVSSTENGTYGFSILYFDNGAGTPNIIAVGDLNTSEGGTTRASNVILYPAFDDPNSDWHLTPSSPLEVRQGGMTIGGITDDIEDNARTPIWSMGAYEFD